MKTKVAFIINSTRKFNSLSASVLSMAEQDVRLDICNFYTDKPKHATVLAENAANEGYEIIIAVGGDGTINEVVNGILVSPKSAKVRMGVVPNGTGNDFQKYLGDFDPTRFIESLSTTDGRWIDLIKVTNTEKSIYALNIAGVGFDGHVVQRLQNSRRFLGLKGKLAYNIAILQSFISFRKSEVQITSEHFTYIGKIMMVAVCNGTTFGHGLIINPLAVIDDGILNVTLLGNVSFIDYIKNLNKLKRGEQIDHPGVTYHSTDKIRITTDNLKLFTQVDGEHFCGGTVEFTLVKSGIKLLGQKSD